MSRLCAMRPSFVRRPVGDDGGGARRVRNAGELGQVFASQAQVDELRARLTTLRSEITTAIRGVDLGGDKGQAMLAIQTDLLNLRVRFDTWSAQTLRGIATLDEFEADYEAIRKRFLDLGGETTTPTPNQGGGLGGAADSVTNLIKAAVPLALIVGAYLVLR